MVRKPTGVLGVNKVSVEAGGGATHAFHQLAFPDGKEDIEAMMVNGFIASMNRKMAPYGYMWPLSSPVQNEQDDYDFTVSLPDGSKAFLELMEIAPLHLFGGFDKVPAKYKPYDLAKIIKEMIVKKAGRYQREEQELHLLTYITHWGFMPSDSLYQLLSCFLALESLPFDGIYVYCPVDEGFGASQMVAPVDAELFVGFDPEQFRENTVINLDPMGWVLHTRDGSEVD